MLDLSWKAFQVRVPGISSIKGIHDKMAPKSFVVKGVNVVLCWNLQLGRHKTFPKRNLHVKGITISCQEQVDWSLSFFRCLTLISWGAKMFNKDGHIKLQPDVAQSLEKNREV